MHNHARFLRERRPCSVPEVGMTDVYYGDLEIIEGELLEKVRKACEDNIVAVPMKAGDVLLGGPDEDKLDLMMIVKVKWRELTHRSLGVLFFHLLVYHWLHFGANRGLHTYLEPTSTVYFICFANIPSLSVEVTLLP